MAMTPPLPLVKGCHTPSSGHGSSLCSSSALVHHGLAFSPNVVAVWSAQSPAQCRLGAYYTLLYFWVEPLVFGIGIPPGTWAQVPHLLGLLTPFSRFQ